jgi:hypothetical protein
MDEIRFLKFVAMYLDEKIAPDCAELAQIALKRLLSEMKERGLESVVNDFLKDEDLVLET